MGTNKDAARQVLAQVLRYEYGTAEHLEHKRAVKREQMRRYRAKKRGKV